MRKYRVLLENFSYLSALQVFNMLLPLVTYPYLIRILGAERYGLVIYAQVVASYFSILIDFGYKISATKDIAINRDSKKKLSEIVSSILIIKLALFLISLILLFILISVIPEWNRESQLFLFSFTLCFNELLFPQWYFQGVERMKYITIINLAARLIFLFLIFLTIKQASDYIYVPLLNGIGAFIGGSVGLSIVFFKDSIKFRIQSWKKLYYYFKLSFPLFSSNAIISIKDRFNVIFIGFSLGMREIAIYDLAIKIMRLLISPVDIINNTIYPRVAKEKDSLLAFKTAKVTFLLMIILIIILQPLLFPIINFLGEGLREAVFPTRILLICPLIMTWSLYLSVNTIIVKGKYKLLLYSMLFTTFFYLVIISLGFILGWKDYLIFYVIVVILVYFFELLIRIFIVKKYNLLN